jgi:hypothetical protein
MVFTALAIAGRMVMAGKSGQLTNRSAAKLTKA